jgi:L-threonylcarbamoyladenylate synthase
MPLLLPTSETIAQLGKILRAGELAALPTETVYGLAADATNPEAVLKIYEAKGRPRFNPLIVHVENLEAAQRYGQFNAHAQQLAQAFWPGPLTLVVPYHHSKREHRAFEIPDLVRAGLPSIAIRVPAHPLMQQVLRATGRPLAAPSANKSGHVSATQASHVANDFGPDLPILEGGPCTLGLESTIVDCTTPTPTLLRAGGLPRAEVEGVLGQTLRTFEPSNIEHAVKAPGMLLKHYAPKAKVRLNATHLEAGEALLAFGDSSFLRTSNLEHSNIRNLSPTSNLAEAALNLFALLRDLDALNPTAIAVMPIPNEGLGEAIADRLERAAAGR